MEKTKKYRETHRKGVREIATMKEPSAYKASFKKLLQQKTLLFIFYDLLFWALFFGGAICFSALLVHTFSPLQAMDEGSIIGVLQSGGASIGGEPLEGETIDGILGEENGMEELLLGEPIERNSLDQELVERAMLMAMVWSAVFGIWVLLAWCFTRGMMWHALMGHSERTGHSDRAEGRAEITTRKFWGKFISVNVLWSIFIGIIAVLVFAAMSLVVPFHTLLSPANSGWLLGAFAIILLISFYFTEILYYRFMAEPKMRVIIDTLLLGIKKFQQLAKPYAIILATFLFLSVITIPLNYFPAQVGEIISTILLLVFAAWMRYYLVEVFDQVLW